MAVPFLACMVATAAFYHLPPRVLPAIQAVEGGRVGTVHQDTDGTRDLGVMQVNTRWIVPIARYTGMAVQAVETRLIGDACFNIAAAGAILRTYLSATGGNLMLAIGDYHSHTPGLNQAYQLQVMGAASLLFGR